MSMELRFDVLGEAAMHGNRVPAEFEHVAEHRDAAALAGSLRAA